MITDIPTMGEIEFEIKANSVIAQLNALIPQINIDLANMGSAVVLSAITAPNPNSPTFRNEAVQYFTQLEALCNLMNSVTQISYKIENIPTITAVVGESSTFRRDADLIWYSINDWMTSLGAIAPPVYSFTLPRPTRDVQTGAIELNIPTFSDLAQVFVTLPTDAEVTLSAGATKVIEDSIPTGNISYYAKNTSNVNSTVSSIPFNRDAEVPSFTQPNFSTNTLNVTSTPNKTLIVMQEGSAMYDGMLDEIVFQKESRIITIDALGNGTLSVDNVSTFIGATLYLQNANNDDAFSSPVAIPLPATYAPLVGTTNASTTLTITAEAGSIGQAWIQVIGNGAAVVDEFFFIFELMTSTIDIDLEAEYGMPLNGNTFYLAGFGTTHIAGTKYTY